MRGSTRGLAAPVKIVRYGSRRDHPVPAPRRGGRGVPGRHRARYHPEPSRGSRRGRSRGPRFHFTDVAAQAGITFVHHGPTLDPKLDNIAPLIGSLGASVSVADVNNDGWPDLYFTNSRFGYPNALYVNRGDGTFVDTARAAGLADVNRPGAGVSMGAVWGDFDNDALEEVLIYKWGYLQLLKNMGNLHFRDVTASAGLRQGMNANGAVWFDYDRDGLLDLYVGGYYRSDIDC